MLSQRLNNFLVCLGSIKSFPRMLSIAVHKKLLTFFLWLSSRENSLGVCSVCNEIVSSYAQCAMKSFPSMLSVQ
jgi:hypothetical protein